MEMPFEITEAMIQCFGRCFHYKDKMEAFLRAAGLNAALAQRHRNEYKFVWARKTLADLGESQSGLELQRRVFTELCKLRNVPDNDVADRDAALGALRGLKMLAVQQDIYVEEEQKAKTDRRALAEERQRVCAERAKKLEALRSRFNDALFNPNHQHVGYFLEELLYELFSLFGIDYRKPYKTATEQIDVHVPFEGFDYLVEARWRKDQPEFNKLAALRPRWTVSLRVLGEFLLPFKVFVPR